MKVTLQGTYGCEWVFDRDLVVAVKAMPVRTPDNGTLAALRVYLRNEPEPTGRDRPDIWLLDTPKNRLALGMDLKATTRKKKEPANA